MRILYITFFLLHAALFLFKCGVDLFVQDLLISVVLISEPIHQFFHRLEASFSIGCQLKLLWEFFVLQKAWLLRLRFGSSSICGVVLFRWHMFLLLLLLLLEKLSTRMILHGPSEIYKFFFLRLFIFILRWRILRIFIGGVLNFGSICLFCTGIALWTAIEILLELYFQLLYLFRYHFFLTIETSALFWWILHCVRNSIKYDLLCGNWCNLLVMQNVFPGQRTLDSWEGLHVFYSTQTAGHWACSSSWLQHLLL